MKLLTKHFKVTMSAAVVLAIVLGCTLWSLASGIYADRQVRTFDTRVVTSTHTTSANGPNSQGIVFVCQDAGTSKVIPDCLVSEVGGTGKYCLTDLSGVCQIDNLPFYKKLKFVAGLKGYADEPWPSKLGGSKASVSLMYPGQLHHFKLKKQ